MTPADWRMQGPGAEAARSLAEEIDAIARLVEEGDLAEARRRTWGRRWAADRELTAVPPSALDDVQGWVDLGHHALTSEPADPDGALDALSRARRLLAG